MVTEKIAFPKEVRSADDSIERIYWAAAMEFGKEGLGLANVDRIARSAGVSKQLIYHYFKRKESLYTETVNRIGTRFFEEVLFTNLDHPDPLKVVRDFAYRTTRFYSENTYAARLVLDQALKGGANFHADRRHIILRTQILRRLSAALGRGHDQGIIDPLFDAERLFVTTISIAIGWLSVGMLIDSFALDIVQESDPGLAVADLVVKAVRV
jgi:AcrR family transcriptional regulator